MPDLICISAEAPNQYIALDEDGRVWSGRAVSQVDGQRVIAWTPAISEFPTSSTPVKLWGGGLPPQDDEQHQD